MSYSLAAPPIYSDFTETTYDDLAKQLLHAVSEHFSREVLSRLCGVAADGPCQATGFAAQLRETLAIKDDDQELARYACHLGYRPCSEFSCYRRQRCQNRQWKLFQTVCQEMQCLQSRLVEWKGIRIPANGR